MTVELEEEIKKEIEDMMLEAPIVFKSCSLEKLTNLEAMSYHLTSTIRKLVREWNENHQSWGKKSAVSSGEGTASPWAMVANNRSNPAKYNPDDNINIGAENIK